MTPLTRWTLIRLGGHIVLAGLVPFLLVFSILSFFGFLSPATLQEQAVGSVALFTYFFLLFGLERLTRRHLPQPVIPGWAHIFVYMIVPYLSYQLLL